MGFNYNTIAKLVKIANGIKSPKQGIKMLLGEISKRNPTVGKQLENAINSGANPTQYLKEQVKQGNITRENFEQVKQGYAMAQKFGLTKKIPQSTWKELEAAFDSNKGSQGNGFTGF